MGIFRAWFNLFSNLMLSIFARTSLKKKSVKQTNFIVICIEENCFKKLYIFILLYNIALKY